MPRPKGSLNKKSQPVQLEFEEIKNIEDRKEVVMTTVQEEDVEAILKELDQARIELQNTKLEIETKKQELKNLPEIAQSPSVSIPAVSIKGEGLSEKILSQKAIDNEMVTGKFYNLRVKGQSKKLPYHKYADDPVKWYSFEHGQVYTIPRGFANQINGQDETGHYYYTPHFIKNENAIIDPSNPQSGIHAVDNSDKMYSFVPINF